MKAWRHIVDDSITLKEPSEKYIGYFVPIEILPAAVHDAEQAAIAAAEEALIDACETCRYSGDNRRMCESINCRWLKVKDARDELRAAKEAE